MARKAAGKHARLPAEAAAEGGATPAPQPPAFPWRQAVAPFALGAAALAVYYRHRGDGADDACDAPLDEWALGVGAVTLLYVGLEVLLWALAALVVGQGLDVSDKQMAVGLFTMGLGAAKLLTGVVTVAVLLWGAALVLHADADACPGDLYAFALVVTWLTLAWGAARCGHMCLLRRRAAAAGGGAGGGGGGAGSVGGGGSLQSLSSPSTSMGSGQALEVAAV